MKTYWKELLCFGLDIGTRTVVGVVGYKEGENFVLIDYECRAHEERAMKDGQIHDIQKVARVVYEIKSTLEKRLEVTLKDVAIAAAGRSLSTQIVEVTKSFDELHEVTLSDIQHLELEGVAKAKLKQQDGDNEKDYYCVAYSVVQYYLEDYMMANLEGHKAREIKARLIVTFLPKQVIDSLYAVIERAEMNVTHLTLEPIAAINAVIPEQIRLLNLALVDVGAGTSDIAITREGSVSAYGMIPNAGDGVTEAIIHKYLVDFNTAESIKKQATTQDKIFFNDIIGLPCEIMVDELREVISPIIKTMTQEIAEQILSLNGGNPPNAVFCVGGGSQMLDVTSSLAKYLGLPEERVALRSTMHMTKVKPEVDLIDTPEMITPLGICMTMVKDKYTEFTIVRVNEQKIKLLNAKKLTILDAIVAAGIEHSAIFPKKGETLMFKLNGVRQRVKGENGSPATILLNGKEASIQEHINDGDFIEVELAANGMSPKMTIGKLVKIEKSIQLEGKCYYLPLVLVNNQPVSSEYEIVVNDEITTRSIYTLGELLESLNIEMENKIVTKNFEKLDSDYILQDGDSFLIDILPSINHKKEDKALEVEEVVSLNEEIEITQEVEEILDIYIIVNGKTICLPKKETDYIFASIFDFIDFDLSKPQGVIKLIKNGIESTLTDPIYDGDVLEIFWKK